jgi:hypothetical protein
VNDSASKIRTLTIKVNNEKIGWYLVEFDTGRSRSNDLDLELSGVERRTIEFLRDVLHQSIDVAQYDKLQSSLTSRLLTVLGEHLYQLLFRGELRSELNQQLKELQSGMVDLLRVELEFQGRAEWMTGLPWEYLHPPRDQEERAVAGGQFLATLATQLFLNRQLSIDSNIVRDLSTTAPVKVLFVSASPRSTQETELPEVNYEPILDALKRLGNRIKLKQLIEGRPGENWDGPEVTREQFKKLVRDFKPNIIHFVGHGQRLGGGQLAFMSSSGEPDWVEDTKFANWAAASPDLKLVFLQACESALPDPYVGVSGVARQIATLGIPAVVAMQYKIEQGVANSFATGFYDALANGEPVDVAVKAGRELISDLPGERTENLSFGLPVLYLRSYDGMIVRDETRRGNALSEITTESIDDASEGCPRCKDPLRKASQRSCSMCRLRFVCKECEERYANPLGNFCDECEARIVQHPWPSKERVAASRPTAITEAARRPRRSTSGGSSLRDAAAAKERR